MASLGHTAVQSKHLTQRELSTRRSVTFMHLAAQTSSHAMQLMHLSGSIAMCMSGCECRHPKAVPIGHTVVQKVLPHFHAEARIAANVIIQAAKPTLTEIPIACHVVSVSAGRTADAALRMMFQGSMT